MTLPYHMFCGQPSSVLYRLSDGRFQIVRGGSLAAFMSGFEYVLAERELASYLIDLKLEGLEISDATIYDPRRNHEIRWLQEIRIQERHTLAEMGHMNTSGERMFVMNDQWVFVTPTLKEVLEASPFEYLCFTEGLDYFAA